MEVLIAVPPVQGPQAAVGRVVQAGDGRATPLRAAIRAPGRPSLNDGQQVAAHLKFDAQLVTKMRGYVMGTPPSHAS